MWDSIKNFFSDLGDFFSGKAFFEISGYIWNDLMDMGADVLVKNPTKGTYADTWNSVSGIYTTLNVLAVTLLCLFFLYGFCRESVDLHSEVTFERTIKLFIRLIIVSNLVSTALTLMPKFIRWGRKLTSAILGESKFGFYFDGAKVYERIADADWGTMVAFLTSMLFFLFTCVCGFMVIFTIMSRIIKIYLMVPFAGMALSTLAAGGQVSQVGYSYIRTFFGQVGSALVIAVAIVISTTFIDTVVIDTENSILILIEYCLKMMVIASAVKGAETLMQKAFNL